MKKLLFLITTLFLFSTFAQQALAVSPTPTTVISPTVSQTLNEKLNSQINQLKDKIASRVTELNLVDKRGIIGTVTDTSANQITLTDAAGNKRQIDVDEITKFSSASSKGTFGLSDLTNGTKISVLGLYNKQSKRILARFIKPSVDPLFLTGVISDIDTKNIRLNIVSDDQKKTNIDVVPATKILGYGKDLGLTKLIFLKLNAGDRIYVIGYPDKKDSTLIVADRIIIFPDLPKDPKISISVPTTPIITVVPTTQSSSVKKITPVPVVR